MQCAEEIFSGIESDERPDRSEGFWRSDHVAPRSSFLWAPRLAPRARDFALGGIRVSGQRRKTDYGTVILHWLLVGALSVAVVSGLRIASEAPDRTWVNVLDGML